MKTQIKSVRKLHISLWCYTFAVAIGAHVFIGSACAQMRSPAGWPAGGILRGSESVAVRSSPLAVVGDWLVRAYQLTASRVDGDGCPSYPVCSVYARQAISRYGIWQGMFMAADRMIHEIDASDNPRRIRVGNHWYIYDPLELNRFD